MKLFDPILKFLAQGMSPERLGLCVAIGVVVGNVPMLGISSIICAGIALAFRMNLPAIQIVQAVMAPTQVLLIIPFVRLGEWLLGISPQHVSIKAGLAFGTLWDAILHAVFAWMLLAPFTILLIFKILTPIFTRAETRP